MAAIARASTSSRSMRALPSPARPMTAALMNSADVGVARAAVPARPFQPPASSARKSSSAPATAGGSPMLLDITMPLSPSRLRCRRSSLRFFADGASR